MPLAGAHSQGEAARRQGRAGGARVRRQAGRLHAAVRGADLDAGAPDAVCRGGTHRGRNLGKPAHRVTAVCTRYVELAVAQADLSTVRTLAIDETSRARGHDYITLAADADARRVVFVTEGRDAGTIERLAEHLQAHGGAPEAIASVSIDMSAAFIKGVREHLPAASITFDKFHVIAHASAAVDRTRRLERRADPALKGLRWTLLKDRRQKAGTVSLQFDIPGDGDGGRLIR